MMNQTQKILTGEEQTLLKNLRKSKSVLPFSLHPIIDGWYDFVNTYSNIIVKDIPVPLNRILTGLLKNNIQEVWDKFRGCTR